MSWFIAQIASGSAFFFGVILVSGAVVLRAASSRVWARGASAAVGAIGALVIALSATPLPWWAYAGWGVAFLVWFVMPSGSKRWRRRASRAEVLLLTATIIAVALELPYDMRPVSDGHLSRIYVVGDSITAGIGREGGRTWPRILRERHGVEVVDLSHAGLGCRAELRRIEHVPLAEGVVLLEIGGNDVLGHVPPAQFGRDLDALVSHVNGPGRRVMMLELPLLPLDNAYGLEQRRVARERRVTLIPKARFAAVLTRDGNTVDGIHLSATGQQQMSEMIWQILDGR